MAAPSRTAGALDLIVYGVAASLTALAVAVYRITEIVSPAGPAVTVVADEASAVLRLPAGAAVDAVVVRAPELGAGGRAWMIAATLSVAVFAWPIVDGMGRQHAVQSLGIRFETLSMLDLLPLLPVILVAVAAAVLAGAFARGERLQRYTEGLV